MLVLRRWKAKAANPRLRGTTVLPWPGDGVANASVSQPAGVTVIQPRELPGSVELSDLGDLCSVCLTRLPGLSQVHLVEGLEIVDSPFEGNTFIVYLFVIALHK